MQKGRIYQHGGQWMFRYKEPVFVNGAKVWKDKYEKLAAVDQYKTAAQVEKDFANKLRNLRGGLDSSKFTPSTTQLLSDFIEHVYFPKQAAINPSTGTARLKDSTLFGYRHLYNRHIKLNLNGERMNDFKIPTAQRFMEKIAGAVPLSSKSLSHIKWFLKAVFDIARTEEAYDSGAVNPFAEVKIPKARKQQDLPTRYATLDNVLDMIDALDEPAATVVSVAALAGLRKSEIQGLRWEDLKNGELHVRRAAWRTTKIETTKTEASQSTVPVMKILAKHLEAHRSGFPPEGFIFVGPKLGKPLDLHNLANRIIRPTLQKCAVCRKSRLDHSKESHTFELDKARSIPWCGWHGFRRGLATNLHTLGVKDVDVQRILRHADVKVTQQSYIKVEDRVRQAALERYERALNKRQQARRRK
jgi:integrase